MLMLKRLTWCPMWTMASMDSPQRGASSTNKYINIMEGATILDSFESVFQESVLRLNKVGITGIDFDTAEKALKGAYQQLRHGLAFDWVVNSCVSIIAQYYPFTYFKEYKGTRSFIDQFNDDPVFMAEVETLHRAIYDVMNWVFEGYPDHAVYRRMAAYAGTNVLADAYEYILKNPPKEPFEIPFLTSNRIGYAILLMDMLTLCVGSFKRPVWTDRIASVKASAAGHEDMLIVVGGKYQAFIYGDLYDDGTVCWHKLQGGIKANGIANRVDRTDVVRDLPDEMTFFRFAADSLIIDESFSPSVQFDLPDGTTTEWIDPRAFVDFQGLTLDTAMKMRIRYPFTQSKDNPKTINLKGANGVIVKDNSVVLDVNGEAETQVVFRNKVISFKVSDPDKQYPFTFFSTNNVEASDTFAWLN